MVKSILSDGESVLIFPEGTRSRTGQLQEFKPGVGLIAQELGVPVVPAYIQGTHQAMPVGKALPRRCQNRGVFWACNPGRNGLSGRPRKSCQR